MKEIGILNQFKGFLNTVDICTIIPQKGIQTFEFPRVNISTELIKDLENLDHSKNSVLGKRMESFFEIAIKYSKRYDLISANIQIIEDKKTLGELDFLVYDKKLCRPLHVEMVYKLYVYDASFSEETKKWIGPNRRDSFFQKLEKLKSRQFPLLYKPETQIFLEKTGYDLKDYEQRLCFKAQLFTPVDAKMKELFSANPECITGNWYSLDEFLNNDWKENLFFSPKKKYWSSNPEENRNWINHSELLIEIEAFFEKQKAPLVWMKTAHGFHRFFIVWW